MNGKYSAYPEYKDSRLDCLESIPSHWGTNKLRYMFSFCKGLTITKENLKEEGVPCVNYGEVHSKYGFSVDPNKDDLKCVSEQYLKLSPSALLSKGDFVFADTSEDIEGSGNFTQLISDQPAFAGYHTVIARPYDRSNDNFFAYLFDSQEFRTQIRLAVKGVKVFSITQAILRGAGVWLPASDERKKITNFLDHETAKIDILIEKQQQLIRLLKEKRQAVISHAVTKGLNPDAPMKDSGVEWLGAVPEHWRVIQLRHLFNSMEQGKSPECEARTVEGDEWGVLKTGCVNGGIFRPREHKALPIHIPPHIKYEVKAGDLLMSRASGSRDLIGAVAYVAATQPKLLLSDKVFRLIPKTGVHPQYVAMLMGAQSVRLQVELSINGAEGLANNITKESIKSFVVALPDQDEQVAISAHLSEQSMKFSILEAKLAEGLGLLLERRTALISAAVTGKIDVRDFKADDTNAD